MRPRCFVGLPLAMLLSAALASAAATLEGHVQLPKPHTAPVMNKRYELVTKGGVVATDPPLAVVYLEGDFGQTAAPPPAQVAQKDYAFVPALLPVQVGTRVEFPNEDDAYHNIFSYSAAKRFDLGRYRADEKPVPAIVFDTAGLVTLRCDIHEHMRGAILVLKTPYFVLSDTSGHFKLTGIPAGHFVLKAWLDSKTTLEHPVEIKDGESAHVDLP